MFNVSKLPPMNFVDKFKHTKMEAFKTFHKKHRWSQINGSTKSLLITRSIILIPTLIHPLVAMYDCYYYIITMYPKH